MSFEKIEGGKSNDPKVEILKISSIEQIAKMYVEVKKERDDALLQIRELTEALELARTHTGLEADGCPLCTYKEGVFIAYCSMHRQLNESNRLNRDLQQLFSEVATMFELTTRHDIDGILRARIQEALAGVAVKRACKFIRQDEGSSCPSCGEVHPNYAEKRVVPVRKCAVCGYSEHSGRCGEQGGSGPEDGYA